MSLQPVEHHGPSVGVKFYGDEDLVFVGCGPLLKIYNYKTGELSVSRKIFKKNKIHGICVDRDVLCIYGARSFSILSLSQIMDLENQILDYEKMVNDWIISGEFSYNGLEVFLLTAHNVILSVDAYSQTLQWEKSVFGEKSILYSGSITVISKHHVFINAGTVMGGVIIWDLYKEQIVHNLVGHEGSIFNVQMSKDTKYIISCSDDRSIKLWDNKTGELLSTAWGHTARIWNLKFYNNNTSVISCSEDLTSRTWKIVSGENDKIELVADKTYELHGGRHIWGLDVNEEENLAVTGGNDGRIRLIYINPLKESSEIEQFSLNEIVLSSGNSEYVLQKNEIIKGFWKLACGLIIITSFGGIFMLRDNTWRLIKIDEMFKNFSLTNGFDKDNIVVFTSGKGYSLFMKFNDEGKIIKELEIKTDVHSIISATSTKYNKDLYLLIESPNYKELLFLYQVDLDLNLIQLRKLSKGPTFVSTCFEINNGIVFVGFRLSTIGIYNLETCEELKLIKKLSISDTVTSIENVFNKGGKTLICIGNRDGYYVYAKYNTGSNEFEVIHSNNTRKGFLEGAFEHEGELIFYGFKSSYFYIYNESREYEIAYENCGGAHRQWKLFLIDQDPNKKLGFQFIYVRNGVLTIRTIPQPTLPYLLNEGTHGRELRDISFRADKLFNNQGLYITGAEDTCLKLSSVKFETGEITNYWTIRKHTSGLQKVKFLTDDLIASSSAREEFFIWKVNEEFDKPLINLIASLPPFSDNTDLRVMDFDHVLIYNDAGEVVKILITTVYSNSEIKVWSFDPKSNGSEFELVLSGVYKTCCIFGLSTFIYDNKLFIMIGATDGFLTLWDISLQLPYEIRGNKLYEVEGIELVPELKMSKPNSTLQVHQNGIKSFEVLLTEDAILVVSGGDDNGLGLSRFSVNSDNESLAISATVECFVPNAASSTITSLNIVPSGLKQVLVVSVDQIVRLWGFEDHKTFKLLDSKYTTVADTGSSSIIQHDSDKITALIGGVGLSVWNVVE